MIIIGLDPSIDERAAIVRASWTEKIREKRSLIKNDVKIHHSSFDDKSITKYRGRVIIRKSNYY